MTRSSALGAYVHWPYCARICPYCDFNVYRERTVDAPRWTSALVRDLKHWRELTGPRPLASLYFGGGTPSLAPIAVIAGVVEACADLWSFEHGAEITLEANPTDAEESRFAAFAAAGVNRLSLGAQAFEDDALKFLGRNHSAAEARRALDSAMRMFAQTSFDVIYALPGETPALWRRRLSQALDFAAPHLSLYQLTIESGTAFAKAVARGAWTPPGEDAAAALFDLAQEMTAARGRPAYEISNHAAPGAESRHNLLYWTSQDWIGVGPGAHGRLWRDGLRLASETEARPAAYLAAVERTGSAARFEMLDSEAGLIERLWSGLRLSQGIDLCADDLATLGPRAGRLEELVAEGLLDRRGARIATTPSGRRVLDAVVARLFA